MTRYWAERWLEPLEPKFELARAHKGMMNEVEESNKQPFSPTVNIIV